MKIEFKSHPTMTKAVVMVAENNEVVLTLEEAEQMMYNLQDVILAQYKRK